MTWTEIENKAITDFLSVIKAAGFIDGDSPTKQDVKEKGIPFFRGFNEDLNAQKGDHCNYDIVPVNDATYADNKTAAVYVSIGIDYITSSKWSLNKVTETRKSLEEAFKDTDWTVYLSGHAYDSTTGRNVFSYDIRKVFSNA